MTTYRLTITTLSPLHIGSGQPPLRLGVDCMCCDGILYVLDMEQVFDYLVPDVNDTERLDTITQTDSIVSFLNEQDFLQHPELARYRLRGEVRGDELLPLMKDVGNRPYIPGSSLKGALRTVLIDETLHTQEQPIDRKNLVKVPRFAATEVERDVVGRGDKPWQSPSYDIFRAMQIADSKPAEPGSLSTSLIHVWHPHTLSSTPSTPDSSMIEVQENLDTPANEVQVESEADGDAAQQTTNPEALAEEIAAHSGVDQDQAETISEVQETETATTEPSQDADTTNEPSQDAETATNEPSQDADTTTEPSQDAEGATTAVLVKDTTDKTAVSHKKLLQIPQNWYQRAKNMFFDSHKHHPTETVAHTEDSNAATVVHSEDIGAKIDATDEPAASSADTTDEIATSSADTDAETAAHTEDADAETAASSADTTDEIAAHTEDTDAQIATNEENDPATAEVQTEHDAHAEDIQTAISAATIETHHTMPAIVTITQEHIAVIHEDDIAISAEIIRPESVLTTTLRIDDYLLSKKAKRLGFGDRRFLLEHIAEMARSHALARIEYEKTFFAANQAPIVRHFYAGLQEQLAHLGEHSFLLNLGWGCGWDSKTLHRALHASEGILADIVRRYRLKRGRRNADGFPTTRHVVIEHQEPVSAPGWVRVDMEKL